MSAFLCSDRHTAVVAMLAKEWGLSSLPMRDLALKLRRENNDALGARYGDTPTKLRMSQWDRTVVAAEEWIKQSTPAQQAGACACFQYQCAEGDTESREGYRLVLAIFKEGEKRAPGYREQRLENRTWAI